MGRFLVHENEWMWVCSSWVRIPLYCSLTLRYGTSSSRSHYIELTRPSICSRSFPWAWDATTGVSAFHSTSRGTTDESTTWSERFPLWLRWAANEKKKSQTWDEITPQLWLQTKAALFFRSFRTVVFDPLHPREKQWKLKPETACSLSKLIIGVLIPKTIGNRKGDRAWGCARGINTIWENLQIKKDKSVPGKRNERLPDLCFSIWRFSQMVFIPRAQPHAQSLFLFPIVFGINLIHFFDEKKDGAAGNSIVCFGASIPCLAIWQR